MELFQEYSLLIAVAAPVGAIVLVNLILYLSGERGTLLLPWVSDFPPVEIDVPPEPVAQAAAIEPGAALGSQLVEAPAVQLVAEPVAEELREAA